MEGQGQLNGRMELESPCNATIKSDAVTVTGELNSAAEIIGPTPECTSLNESDLMDCTAPIDLAKEEREACEILKKMKAKKIPNFRIVKWSPKLWSKDVIIPIIPPPGYGTCNSATNPSTYSFPKNEQLSDDNIGIKDMTDFVNETPKSKEKFKRKEFN